MEYVIHKSEYINLKEHKRVSARLQIYWQDLVSNLPKELQQKVESKSFTLKPHPLLKDENINYTFNLCFSISGSSKKLSETLEELQNVVICMADPV